MTDEITSTNKNMSKPAVAHFIHRYLFITGSWIYNQLVNFRKYRPFVLTSKIENMDIFPFDSVYRYRGPVSEYSLWQIALGKIYESITRSRQRYFIEKIKENHAQLLHAHFGTEAYYQLELRRKLKLPLITTFYGADMSALPHKSPKWRKRYRKLFVEGDLFLAEGPFMAQKLVDLGCHPDKVRVHHLGVDVEQIQFWERKLVEDGPVRILMAGSFREKKGFIFGIQAFIEALRFFPNMQLRIIGGAKTNKEQLLMDHCRDLVRKADVNEKVLFLGYVPYNRYLSEIKKAHLFMAPSVTAADGDSEGGAPVAIIEASAAGMPIISTLHADIPHVVINGKTGILVPERDVKSLASAILELASSPEVWPAMGRNGRILVEQEFNVCRQVELLERQYDHILEQEATRRILERTSPK